MSSTAIVEWLVDSAEPWTRYRVLVDLLGRSESAPKIEAARAAMLAHPQVQGLIVRAATWPGRAIQRHNDASHPIYALSTLADFGLRGDDPGMDRSVEAVLAHRSADGALQSLLNIAPSFGGTGQDTWSWVLCDAPTLLYALLAMGLGTEPDVQAAVEHLVSAVDENPQGATPAPRSPRVAGAGVGSGWRCRCGPELGKFRGPGRKADPCPIANVYALKALSFVPELLDSPATRLGAEMLLSHWERRGETKFYLFGIGSDFRKLKYPFVWYDILHVADVLSRFPFVFADPRFGEMVAAITAQADTEGRYTAGSMYQAWKGWSFADKKRPSPWLTFLVLRIQRRIGATVAAV